MSMNWLSIIKVLQVFSWLDALFAQVLMTVIFQVHNMETEVPTSVCHSVDVNTEEQTDYFPFQPVVGTICKAILCTHPYSSLFL